MAELQLTGFVPFLPELTDKLDPILVRHVRVLLLQARQRILEEHVVRRGRARRLYLRHGFHHHRRQNTLRTKHGISVDVCPRSSIEIQPIRHILQRERDRRRLGRHCRFCNLPFYKNPHFFDK